MALTPSALRKLRSAGVGKGGNRLALAMSLVGDEGLTQAELAAATGLTQPYVSAVSRGAFTTITVENAHKFAEFFGCAIEDLFPSKTAVAS